MLAQLQTRVLPALINRPKYVVNYISLGAGLVSQKVYFDQNVWVTQFSFVTSYADLGQYIKQIAISVNGISWKPFDSLTHFIAAIQSSGQTQSIRLIEILYSNVSAANQSRLSQHLYDIFIITFKNASDTGNKIAENHALLNLAPMCTFSGIYTSPLTSITAQIKTYLTNGQLYDVGMNSFMINDSKASLLLTLPMFSYIDSIKIYLAQRTYQKRPLGACLSLSFDQIVYHAIINDSTVTLTGQNNVECIQVNVKSFTKFLHIAIQAQEYFKLHEVMVTGRLSSSFTSYPIIDTYSSVLNTPDYAKKMTFSMANAENFIAPINTTISTAKQHVTFKDGYNFFRESLGSDTIESQPYNTLIADKDQLSSNSYAQIAANTKDLFWPTNSSNVKWVLLELINQIRHLDFDQFSWHDSYPRRASYTDQMIADPSKVAAYTDWVAHCNNNSIENWIENVDYLRLFYNTNNSAYLNTWFQITGSYFSKMPDILINTSTTMIGSLDELFRYTFMIKTLAGFCKMVLTTTKPSWTNVLGPATAIQPSQADQLLQIIPKENFFNILTGFLKLQYTMHIYGYENSGKVPNQRFSGIYGLTALGYMFQSLMDYQKLKYFGSQYFKSYIQTNIFLDGGMLEQSWNYNFEIQGLANEIIGYGDSFSSEKALLDKFSQYVTSLKSPMNTLPRLGSFSESNGYMALWTLKKDQVTAQSYNTVFNQYTGVHALRTGWHYDDLYMNFINSRSMRGHRLRQNNAVEVYAYGRRLLCQAGAEPYSADHLPDSQKAQFQQFYDYFGEPTTRSRNTIVINDLSQNAGTEMLSTVNTTIPGEYAISSNMDIVSGTFTAGYGSIMATHKRRILFDKILKLWVIIDTIGNVTQSLHISQVWNFPPNNPSAKSPDGFAESAVLFDSGNHRVYTNDGAQNPQIEIIHPNKDVSYQKYYGTTGSVYRGWYSPSIVSERVPKVDIYCNKTISAAGSIITVINPIPPNSVNQKVTIVSSSTTQLVIKKSNVTQQYTL